jgi:uncharacterized protein (TIGR02246 family)
MTPSKILLLLVVGASCAPAPAAFTDADRERAEAEVRAASMALVDALNAHDADSVLTFYSLDDDFTYVPCTDMLFGGKLFSGITRNLHATYRDAVYTMEVRSLRLLGPDAAVVSLSGTMLTPLFTTRVLRRGDDGRWRIVWEHESWPGCADPTPPHPGMEPGDTAALEPVGGF